MPVLKNVIAPLALGSTIAAAQAGIQKNILTGDSISLSFIPDDIKEIKHIIDLLEKDGKLLPGTMKFVEGEMKEQRGEFLSMLLDSLAASLIPSLFGGKGIKGGVIRAGQGIKRAGQK